MNILDMSQISFPSLILFKHKYLREFNQVCFPLSLCFYDKETVAAKGFVKHI